MVLSSTEIMVTWDMVPPIDQNGIITMYEVQYEPLETFNGAIGTLSETVLTSNMTVTLTALQEFVEYNISVRAFTVVGPSPYSLPVTQTTLEDGKANSLLTMTLLPMLPAPSAAPRNVTATALTFSSVLVEWDELLRIDQSGIVIAYEVLLQWTAVRDGISVMEERRQNSTGLSITVADLAGDVLYNVSVRAYTVAGAGSYSTPPFSVMTPEGRKSCSVWV